MFRFMKQKLLHKKWMVICLLIGNILLVAISSSNPMYQNAALQKTLDSKFSDLVMEKGKNPGQLKLEASVRIGNAKHGQSYEEMKNLSNNIAEDLRLKQQYNVTFHSIAKTSVTSLMNREDNKRAKSARICSLSDLKDHVKILSGEMYSEAKVAEDGIYEAIISQRAMNKMNLLIGEVLEVNSMKMADGKPMKIKITGVFENSEKEDPYWTSSPSDYYMEIFISQNLFESTFINLKKPSFSFTTNWYVLFDYKAVMPKQVDSIVSRTSTLSGGYTTKITKFEKPSYMDVLKDYQVVAKKIKTTLLILQIPVLALLLAFIFMISRQMLDLEQNEIALLKSRGSSKKQILTIYFLQSTILSGISLLIGLPIGIFLCEILGSTNGFLEFIQRKAIRITLSPEVFLYAIGAMIISIAFMVLPVFKDAEVTIVNLKQKKNKKGKSLLKKVYVDVIMLLISIYGLYSFSARSEALTTQMLQGESLDPFLFLCSSLFIVSASFVSLRIQPLLIRLVYLIGKKRWKPAFFASFLQILRTKGKQSFMMVFLMLTVSLGIFNATVARTILSNSEKGIRYSSGADLVVGEKWNDNSVYREYDPTLELSYEEPDFGIYQTMEGVEQATKVFKDDKNIVTEAGSKQVKATLMAIDTKSFGQTVTFQKGLLPIHINNYLNAMGSVADGFLLSKNYHEKYDIKVGDSFVVKYTDKKKDDKVLTGIVYGFVDYWPGYVQNTHELNDSNVLITKENYLVISNLAKTQLAFGLKPYEIWIKNKDSSQYIYEYAEKNNVYYNKFSDVASLLVDLRNDPLFQGTNGILTMSFIVILILCSTGFLIYWILSIRQRELLFGVFRAMGMTKKEIIQMLINEQIFSSGVSIAIGTVLGLISAKLFVPLVQIFYSSTEQAIPLEVVRENLDMVRLFCVITFVIIICIVVLGRLVSKIRISQALKLGEE